MIEGTTAGTLLLIFGVIAYIQIAHRLNLKLARRERAGSEFYLFKIARITGQSEYDVFCKSAEGWPVSKNMIDHDFKDYLLRQRIPYYVNDFIRKNKNDIDQFELPPF